MSRRPQLRIQNVPLPLNPFGKPLYVTTRAGQRETLGFITHTVRPLADWLTFQWQGACQPITCQSQGHVLKFS